MCCNGYTFMVYYFKLVLLSNSVLCNTYYYIIDSYIQECVDFVGKIIGTIGRENQSNKQNAGIIGEKSR